LESREAAETMAERVATWPQKYGIDGIDLDLEDGAGDTPKAGPNMIHFVKKLR
jgi:chitinase